MKKKEIIMNMTLNFESEHRYCTLKTKYENDNVVLIVIDDRTGNKLATFHLDRMELDMLNEFISRMIKSEKIYD